MVQFDQGTAHGSCGHYVFTSSEWAAQHGRYKHGPMDSHGTWANLLVKTEHLPSDGKAPCDGPGCRGGGFPMNAIASQFSTGEKEPLDIVLFGQHAERVKSDCEYPNCFQFSIQEHSEVLLRPPRV